MMAKYLATSLAIENVVTTSRDQQLLADLDHVDELGRVRVEVDHVAGLLGRHGAGVHRHADVACARAGASLVRHRSCDELPPSCSERMSSILVSGVASPVVVDARLLGDGRRGEGLSQ